MCYDFNVIQRIYCSIYHDAITYCTNSIFHPVSSFKWGMMISRLIPRSFFVIKNSSHCRNIFGSKICVPNEDNWMVKCFWDVVESWNNEPNKLSTSYNEQLRILFNRQWKIQISTTTIKSIFTQNSFLFYIIWYHIHIFMYVEILDFGALELLSSYS